MCRWILLPALLLAGSPAWGAPKNAPNVVFILADDLGWSDTTINGTTRFYQTPNLERLRKRGMRFTNAYAASPVCSPTRCSILTGLYPGRVGITGPVCHQPDEREEARLLAKIQEFRELDEATSAKSAGSVGPRGKHVPKYTRLKGWCKSWDDKEKLDSERLAARTVKEFVKVFSLCYRMTSAHSLMNSERRR